MQHISHILHSLGFVESETKTYIASLEQGPGTVIDLTKRTKLSRQATYVAIETLTNRGLMSSLMKGKKKYYVSEDPDKLLSYAERKQQEMKEKITDLGRVLPELKLKAHGERPVVKMFEGKEGIKAIMEEVEHSKLTYLKAISDVQAVNQVLSREDTAPLREVLLKNKVKVDYLVPVGTPPAEISNNLVLPEEYNHFNSEIMIIDNKIVFVTFEGKMNSVIIESAALTKTLGILFDLAAKHLK
ncbi:MAG: helix-turn-helix domain-containing protein [Patescibacteria group bacterium]